MPRFKVWFINGARRLAFTEVTEKDGFEAAFRVRNTLAGKIVKVEPINEEKARIEVRETVVF